MNSKPIDYANFKRKVCQCPHQEECFALGLAQPWKMSQFGQGLVDCENVDLWSAWQGSLDAKIMVLGQDWGDIELFKKCVNSEGICHETGQATNNRLVRLLRLFDNNMPLPEEDSGYSRFYFGNSALCIRKEKGMSHNAQTKWFNNCSGHLIQRLKIVQPNIIIPLGETSYRAIVGAIDNAKDGLKTDQRPGLIEYDLVNKDRKATSPISYSRFLDLVESSPVKVRFENVEGFPDTQLYVFPVFHCGAQGLFNRAAEEYCRNGGSKQEKSDLYKEFRRSAEKRGEFLGEKKKERMESFQISDWQRIKDWTDENHVEY